MPEQTSRLTMKGMAQDLRQVLKVCLKDRELKIICACYGIGETEKGLEEIMIKWGSPVSEFIREKKHHQTERVREDRNPYEISWLGKC